MIGSDEENIVIDSQQETNLKTSKFNRKHYRIFDWLCLLQYFFTLFGSQVRQLTTILSIYYFSEHQFANSIDSLRIHFDIVFGMRLDDESSNDKAITKNLNLESTQLTCRFKQKSAIRLLSPELLQNTNVLCIKLTNNSF